jgi:hypothetical protein
MVESLSTNPDITNEQVEEYNDDYEKDKILFERLKRIKKPITTFEEPVYHKRFKPHELIYSTRFSPPSQQIKDNYKNHMSDFITGNKQQILYAIFYTPARYEKLKGYKKDIESIFYKVIFKPGKPAYDLATQTDEFLNTLNDTIKGLRQGYSRTSDTMKYIDEKYTDIMKKYAELPKKKPFKFTFSLGAGTKIGGTRKKKKIGFPRLILDELPDSPRVVAGEKQRRTYLSCLSLPRVVVQLRTKGPIRTIVEEHRPFHTLLGSELETCECEIHAEGTHPSTCKTHSRALCRPEPESESGMRWEYPSQDCILFH